MSDYTTNFKKSEPAPIWSYPLSLVEYEAEIERLKAHIKLLEEEIASLKQKRAEDLDKWMLSDEIKFEGGEG